MIKRLCQSVTALYALVFFCGMPMAGPIEDALSAFESADYERSMALAMPLAKQGDASAQTMVGIQYLYGHGIVKNESEAAAWLKKSSALGDALGQFTLGMMYAQGMGVKASQDEALKNYRLAAAQGFPLARMAVARAYVMGEGVPQSDAEAVKWYRPAAEEGFAPAQFALGMAYLTGKGTTKDQSAAATLLRRAAEQNYVDAQLMLGQTLLETNNDAEAVGWFRRAAELGSSDAQNALGRAYTVGLGVPKDQILGYMWLHLGAVDTYQEAIADRDNARKQMLPADIAKAEALAEQCRRERFKNCGL
jgi:TPR repeat protein